MSNKMIKKAAACTLSAVMAFGLVAVTDAPKTTNVSAATKKVKKLSFKKERLCNEECRTLDERKNPSDLFTKKL